MKVKPPLSTFGLNGPASGGEEITLSLTGGDLTVADFTNSGSWSTVLEAGATSGSFDVSALYDSLIEGRTAPFGEAGQLVLGGDVTRDARLTDVA